MAKWRDGGRECGVQGSKRAREISIQDGIKSGQKQNSVADYITFETRMNYNSNSLSLSLSLSSAFVSKLS